MSKLYFQEFPPVSIAGVDYPLHLAAALERVVRHQESGFGWGRKCQLRLGETRRVWSVQRQPPIHFGLGGQRSKPLLKGITGKGMVSARLIQGGRAS